MEQKVLAFHSSRKRKRDEDDHREASPARPLTTLCCDTTNHGNSYLGDGSVEGNDSPRGLVAGRLRDLDIKNTQNPDGLSSNKHGGVAREVKEDVPSAKSPRLSTGTATPTGGEESGINSSGRIEPLSAVSLSPATAKVKDQQPHRTRYKSPPLEKGLEENSLTWQESEITGYDAKDPNDDGYGLNGVGFKPSATVAWDRAQRRKTQIAEWNKRESREARNKRRERRDGIAADPNHPQNATNQKRVKFDI